MPPFPCRYCVDRTHPGYKILRYKSLNYFTVTNSIVNILYFNSKLIRYIKTKAQAGVRCSIMRPYNRIMPGFTKAYKTYFIFIFLDDYIYNSPQFFIAHYNSFMLEWII